MDDVGSAIADALRLARLGAARAERLSQGEGVSGHETAPPLLPTAPQLQTPLPPSAPQVQISSSPTPSTSSRSPSSAPASAAPSPSSRFPFAAPKTKADRDSVCLHDLQAQLDVLGASLRGLSHADASPGSGPRPGSPSCSDVAIGLNGDSAPTNTRSQGTPPSLLAVHRAASTPASVKPEATRRSGSVLSSPPPPPQSPQYRPIGRGPSAVTGCASPSRSMPSPETFQLHSEEPEQQTLHLDVARFCGAADSRAPSLGTRVGQRRTKLAVLCCPLARPRVIPVQRSHC